MIFSSKYLEHLVQSYKIPDYPDGKIGCRTQTPNH